MTNKITPKDIIQFFRRTLKKITALACQNSKIIDKDLSTWSWTFGERHNCIHCAPETDNIQSWLFFYDYALTRTLKYLIVFTKEYETFTFKEILICNQKFHFVKLFLVYIKIRSQFGENINYYIDNSNYIFNAREIQFSIHKKKIYSLYYSILKQFPFF